MSEHQCRYDEDEVWIDVYDVAWDADGKPIRTRLIYTDATNRLSYNDVREFAVAEVQAEGWPLLEIRTVPEDRCVIVEVGDLGPEFAAMAG